MRRIQAFEFCERAETPAVIREGIIELLGRGLRLSPVFETATPVFYEFCERAKAERILDLGSGSGEPAALLIEALNRRGLSPPDFFISDLIPNLSKMDAVANDFTGKIKVIREPLDATNVPDDIDHQARTIFNTFHHFPPPLARKILGDAVAKRKAVFILEAFPRNFINFTGMLPFLTRAYFESFFQKKKSVTRTLAYLLIFPFVGFLGLWDGCVSIGRTYNKEEMMQLVKPLGDAYVWEYREISFGRSGAVLVFSGLPKLDT